MENNTDKIILIGMKGCGKTTVGKVLAEKLQVQFVDSDAEIERAHMVRKNETLTFREIFKKYGAEYFYDLDAEMLQNITEKLADIDFVFACAGGTPLQEKNQETLRNLGTIMFLNVEKHILLKRILKDGIPVFFPYQDDPEKSLDELLEKRLPIYEKLGNFKIDITNETPEEIADKIIHTLK
jgi:shikimate kinase